MNNIEGLENPIPSEKPKKRLLITEANNLGDYFEVKNRAYYTLPSLTAMWGTIIEIESSKTVKIELDNGQVKTVNINSLEKR